jgi:hypothetical protein
MRILGWSNAQGGIHHYRIREPLRGLSLLGHETKSTPAVVAEAFEHYDVVIVRALHNPHNSQAWRWAAKQERRALLVYDLDDDIWAWNPSTDTFRYWGDEQRWNAELNIQCADLVTTTTSRLADVLAELNPRVAILPNCIPEKLLSFLPNHREKFIVGWQGALQHVRDLQLVYNPLFRFMLRHSDVEFHLWGPQSFVDLPKGLAERVVCHPWQQSVWQYYFSLSMDVGLAPLDTLDRFNETKSDIRLREYAALGIPFIASRGVTYHQAATETRNFLATSEREWEDCLELLYQDQAMRSRLSASGRNQARYWTTEWNARRWEVTYERARAAASLRASAGTSTSERPAPNDYDRYITTVKTRGRT